MSQYIEIHGGIPLFGAVQVSGAKNAVLPMLLASLLTSERCEFHNVPNLADVSLTIHLLQHFGAEVERVGDCVVVSVPNLKATEASYSLVKALRASFWVLGPLLARGRAARVALPGGDIIGARPVDLHLAGLTKMGADIHVKHGVVYASAVKGLKPAEIEFRFPSVGATHQILLAASLTPGTTVIHGAAREPEVVALAKLLNQMGGDIEGAGTTDIVVRGKEELGGASVELIGDRIEAATYLLAIAAAGGHVTVRGVSPDYFGEFLPILDHLGLDVTSGHDFVSVERSRVLKTVNVKTGPFPEFATDIQALLMAVLCLADGVSTVEESVFEGRFGHVAELCRMGAKISVEDRIASIEGVPNLTGAQVEAFDIRGAAALVIAGLAAEKHSILHECHHIRRGYQNLEAKLRMLGARIWTKQSDPEDYLSAGC